ncbi:MAG: hypothetical protein LC747_04460 [Acidobacteria bacterium]|nr:hypothetical protein [Acidobacteriota bacterium]
MSVSLLTAQELFGLFELDAAGTVLYYRIEPRAEPGGTSPDMAGHNFYEEVAPFENVEEFRRCVARFTRGEKPADNFNFDCRYADYAQPVKVLLARIRERVDRDTTKSVLVHIRQGA